LLPFALVVFGCATQTTVREKSSAAIAKNLGFVMCAD
jgi:hypothetical protein